jgi:hypothetical protein
MSLTDVPLADGELVAVTIPPAVEALIVEAERRFLVWEEETLEAPIYSFIPCDYRAVYRGLAVIKDRRLAPGGSFCEWGSGQGVVAMMAASLGWHSIGIEVEPDLVEASRELAATFDLPVEFVIGSYVPEGTIVRPDAGAELAWLDDSAEPAYEELGMDPDDFDVTFAYPWPGESEVIYDLFEEHAARGALLVTFHGTEGLRLHRR